MKDWKIVGRGPEPKDLWSQSLVYGDVALPAGTSVGGAAKDGSVRVRFTNTGGKQYRKAEAHLAYAAADPSANPAHQTAFGFVVAASPRSSTPSWGTYYSLSSADTSPLTLAPLLAPLRA